MKLYSFFLCLISLVAISHQQKCHTEQLDLCFSPVFITARRALVPVDENAIENRCARLNTMWECIDRFLDSCTTEEHHLLIDLINDNSRMVTEEFCLKGSKLQTEFLKFAPCISEAFENARYNCLSNLESVIYQITGNDMEARMSSGCCYFNKFYECFFNQLDASCGRESFPVVKRSIQMMNANYVRHACSTYNPSGNICLDVLNRNVTAPTNKNADLARILIYVLKAYH